MSEAEWKARAVALAHRDLLRITAAAAVVSARSARARRGWQTRRYNQVRAIVGALQLERDLGLGEFFSALPTQRHDDAGG